VSGVEAVAQLGRHGHDSLVDVIGKRHKHVDHSRRAVGKKVRNSTYKNR
jgi:hypothetical protein